MKKLLFVFMAVAIMGMAGCAGTIPTDSYTPQNFVRFDHNNPVDMGNFTYQPFLDGKVKPNQIQNTAIGSIYVSSNVAEMVRRATALELEKTGLKLTDKTDIAVAGDVLELKADDLGYSVDWTYAVRYKILAKKDNSPLFTREYRPPMKSTGKFGLPSDLAPIVHEVILNGYDMFIRDPEVQKLLDKAPEPEKKK
jgi:hypothetical protein